MSRVGDLETRSRRVASAQSAVATSDRFMPGVHATSEGRTAGSGRARRTNRCRKLRFESMLRTRATTRLLAMRFDIKEIATNTRVQRRSPAIVRIVALTKENTATASDPAFHTFLRSPLPARNVVIPSIASTIATFDGVEGGWDGGFLKNRRSVFILYSGWESAILAGSRMTACAIVYYYY